jgi:replicative DNA helicase
MTIRQNFLSAMDVAEDEIFQDHPTEARLLSCVLQFGIDAYIDIEGIVTLDTFTEETNQIIWRTIENFFECEELPKLSAAIVMKYADALGYRMFFENKDEKDYLRALFSRPVELQDAKVLGVQLKKLEIKRQFMAKLQLAKQALINISTVEPLNRILSCVEDPISNFIASLASTNTEGELLAKNADLHIKNMMDNPNTILGLRTGFNHYDEFIGGSLEPETMHVIVARAKTGKSGVALNVGKKLARENTPVIIGDIEMSEQKWLNRLLANVTKINLRKFKISQFNEEEKDLLSDATKQIMKWPLYYLNVNGKSLEETLSCVKRILNKKIGKSKDGKYGDCLFIYDYLRLNDSGDMSKNMQEYQALGFNAIKLKNFAIYAKLPILTFVQANRSGVDKEDTTVASGSDRILWLCDSMTIFKRKELEELQEDRAMGRRAYNRKMIPLETRDGPEVESGQYINYNFDGSTATIEEGPTNVETKLQQTKLSATEADDTTDF